MIIVLVLFIILMLEGAHSGEWWMFWIGFIPISFGLVGGLLQFFGERQLQKLQKENPKIKEICDEIDRIKRR